MKARERAIRSLIALQKADGGWEGEMVWNTMILSQYVIVMTAVGRKLDFVIQEIDVPTGDVLFEWHALDHVPRSASYVPKPSSG